MNDWDSMVAELGTIPDLPGARCRGLHELFDQTIIAPRGQPHDVEIARSAALQVCGRCPAIDACRAWFDSIPRPTRPLGVIAGRIHTKENTP